MKGWQRNSLLLSRLRPPSRLDSWLAFSGRFIWVVSRIRIKHRRIEALVVADGIQEALGRHVAVVVAGKAIWRHDALHETVVIVNFLFQVALFIDGIAPGESLLYREMTIRVEVQGDTLILR